MPWYDFECPKCGKVVEDEPMSISDIEEGKKVKCPECDTEMDRLLCKMRTRHGSWAEWRLSALGNVD